MTALPKNKKMTVDEFFSWAQEQDGARFELVAGEVFAMAPETADYARVKLDIAIAFRAAIKAAGLPCEAFVDGLSVRIVDDMAYQPDALINCGEPVPPKSLYASNPIIVLEVISPSSRRRDTAIKLQDYFRVPSIYHYLVIDIGQRRAVHYWRSPTGKVDMAMIDGGRIAFTPPGLEIDLADLFISLPSLR